MPIDLRSDTVTLPTEAMKAAMTSAPLGDDVYGEDPTAQALEARVAALLGKEAALFVPSGTMGNQIAILVATQRGDDVYCGEGSHCVWYESGAAAAWSGAQLVEIGRGGLFRAEELEAAIKPRGYHLPNPSLCVLENTHNRGGGKVFPQEEVVRIAQVARARGLALHLDGARLWNAAVATGHAESELAAPFDTVCVCFSKGLGAPIGSVLAGSKQAIEKARRFRKMLGGGMRQVGVLAAACRYALDHHRARLREDHDAAARYAAIVADSGLARAERPETNIVMVDLEQDATAVTAALAARGVLVNVFGPRRLRIVTHLDVAASEVEAAADITVSVLAGKSS